MAVRRSLFTTVECHDQHCSLRTLQVHALCSLPPPARVYTGNSSLCAAAGIRSKTLSHSNARSRALAVGDVATNRSASQGLQGKRSDSYPLLSSGLPKHRLRRKYHATKETSFQERVRADPSRSTATSKALRLSAYRFISRSWYLVFRYIRLSIRRFCHWLSHNNRELRLLPTHITSGIVVYLQFQSTQIRHFLYDVFRASTRRSQCIRGILGSGC